MHNILMMSDCAVEELEGGGTQFYTIHNHGKGLAVTIRGSKVEYKVQARAAESVHILAECINALNTYVIYVCSICNYVPEV